MKKDFVGAIIANYKTTGRRERTYICENNNLRFFTPKECFRLQGWTDDYFEKAQLVNSDSQLYKQAGNGVTVNVIEAIAKNMYKEGLMKECCGNCKYNKYAPDGNGVRNGKFYCGNEESSEYGAPTFYDDSCDEWEEKE